MCDRVFLRPKIILLYRLIQNNYTSFGSVKRLVRTSPSTEKNRYGPVLSGPVAVALITGYISQYLRIRYAKDIDKVTLNKFTIFEKML